MEQEELYNRLCQETERALRYSRALSILMFDIGTARQNTRRGIFELAEAAVRQVDIAGWFSLRELVIVLPETADSGEIPAKRLLQRMIALAPEVRGALAIFPRDGIDADELIGHTRQIVATARPGQLAVAGQKSDTINIGTQTYVAADPKMKRVFALTKSLANTEMSVLVTGETGVGKELIAGALHFWSRRSAQPLVSLNCAAIPESLLESELFGYAKGAFSGAVSAKPGLIESAAGGTLFLDEIGETSVSTQAKLLRVLETRMGRRIGSNSEYNVDVRFVAATNRDLYADLTSGRFRRDLYYRLRAAVIDIPPLRMRPLDVSHLAHCFLDSARQRFGGEPLLMSPAAMELLQRHSWPGNVRELKNLMEFAASITKIREIDAEHLMDQLEQVDRFRQESQSPSRSVAEQSPVPAESPTEREFRPLADEICDLERQRIREALIAADGVRIRAAELIGMPLRTLVTKLKRYGLSDIPSSRRRAKSRGD